MALIDYLNKKVSNTMNSLYGTTTPVTGPQSVQTTPLYTGGQSVQTTVPKTTPYTFTQPSPLNPNYVAPKAPVTATPIQAPIVNDGYSTIPGPYDPKTGLLKSGGTAYTADGLPLPTGLTPEEEADMQRLRGDLTVETPNEADIYNNRLRMYQSQIDSINSIYGDLINRAQSAGNIRKTGALGSNRALQARSGLLGNTMGQSQTTNVAAAQDEITGAEVAVIANEQAQKISQLLGMARQDASKEYEAKLEAKRKGGEALLKYYEDLPEKRKAGLSNWAKNLIVNGIDLATISDADIEEIAKNYSVGSNDVMAAIKSAEGEASAGALESEKAQLGVEKLRKENELIGKMTPYQAAQIGISSAHLKIAQERAAKEDSEDYQNFNEGSIPPDVKGEIIFDLQQNKNVKKKQRKTIQDLFNAYPEVETSYLLELWAQENQDQG